MKVTRKIQWLWQPLSMLLLATIDLHRWLRRAISRAFLRVVLVVLVAGMVLMVFSSMLALRSVTLSVRNLIDDSLVGLESAVALRSAVRESHLEVLRLNPEGEQGLSENALQVLETNASEQLSRFLEAASEQQDKVSADLIQDRLAAYLAVFRELVGRAPNRQIISKADVAAKNLTAAIDEVYQSNRSRVRNSVQEAGGAARAALNISTRLWWSFAIAALCCVVIALAYRWLALPENFDG